MLIFSQKPDSNADPIEHYGKLLFELSDTITSVQHDHRLAMYRAHQHGMPPEEIARRAHANLGDVEDAIDTLSREPEADEWQIAAWVPRYYND